jgi:NAD(P)-dependent dehydrogenase (short-subunit alcohol dehydrogenase family)
MKLKGKTAIVTGSQRGIGEAIAIELAKEGANIVVSDINLVNCQKVAKNIEKLGVKAIGVKCDVTKRASVNAMIKKTMSVFKRVDILVNNAGVVVQKPFVDFTDKDWDFTFDVNMKGVFYCSQAVAKHMITQKSGKIINIASIAGLVGFANSSAYCATKGGVVNFTRELSLELAPVGINVNCIAPGVILTDMTKDILKQKSMKDYLLSNIPMGKIGEPKDIARPVVFLASDDAKYISGETITVDGGWTSK